MEQTTCRDCIHWRRVGLGSRVRVCHYLEDTGCLRRCPPDRCDRKETSPDAGAGPSQAGPWLLEGGEDRVCLGCGEVITGPALEVTDLAQLPWRYAFLHPAEECRLAFYREHRQACLDFFSWEVERQVVALLGDLEALQ